jgi:hypothetical protein
VSGSPKHAQPIVCGNRASKATQPLSVRQRFACFGTDLLPVPMQPNNKMVYLTTYQHFATAALKLIF